MLLVLLTLYGALFTDHSKTQASPIYSSWSKYLMGGPSVWASVPHPPITAAIRAEIWKDIKTDPGGTDLMIQWLLWKQSVDPARFAFYHPHLAPALNKITATTGGAAGQYPPNHRRRRHRPDPRPANPRTEQLAHRLDHHRLRSVVPRATQTIGLINR